MLKKITLVRLVIADFLLLSGAFFLSNYVKRNGFDLSAKYEVLLVLFYLCWFFTAWIGKKFKAESYETFWRGISVFLKSGLYLTYSISFAVVFFGLIGYSRVHIFSTCLALVILEILIWVGFYRFGIGRIPFKVDRRTDFLRPRDQGSGDSYRLFAVDLFIVLVSFFTVNYLKRGELALPPEYDKLLLILLGLWFVISMVTRKFSVNKQLNFYFNLWQWLKTGLLMLAIMSVLVFGLRLFYYSRLQGFGTIGLLMLIEVVFLTFYYWGKREAAESNDIESVDEVKWVLGQEPLSMDFDIEDIRRKLMEPARIKLEQRMKERYPEFLSFIVEHVNLDKMIQLETAVENSCEPLVLHSDTTPVRLFVNLHKINDIRNINRYFLQVHRMLLPGGYFMGEAHTIRTHREWIYCKFPRQIAHVVYLLDFCFNRIMPKLPGFNHVYFALTKGKNRIISKAEIMGRLCFCGFEIVAEREINKRFCVIARKIKTPSLDTSPTYGPLVTLKRSGINGSVVHIYKFRTMHPYSEYLQEYVYKLQGLKKGGKLEDDFRMTEWGKFMRKCWLDELPMLYNWLKGDLQIVGVRPLSFHYLSLYDAGLRELRKRVKPGLVPPFYADLPETFDEICDSERRYIKAFLKHPITTQVFYFWKAFVNIAIRGARSN